jgi:hypothetical protein
MFYIVTVTERTPTPDGTDVNSYHVKVPTFQAALDLLSDQDANFTVWVTTSITFVKE